MPPRKSLFPSGTRYFLDGNAMVSRRENLFSRRETLRTPGQSVFGVPPGDQLDRELADALPVRNLVFGGGGAFRRFLTYASAR
jgi:hypothetical protein